MKQPCTCCDALCPDQLLTRLVGAGAHPGGRRRPRELCPSCHEAWLADETRKAISMEARTHTVRRGAPAAGVR